MTEITIDGEVFNIDVEGSETAPVLMLSNSLGTNLHMWDVQMPAFLEHFRVVRYDSRGHGKSVANEGPYTIAQLGQDALNIMDALDLDTVNWLGLSKGGMVGQWLLTHAPKRIARAVLANTAAQTGTPDLWNGRIEAVMEHGMEAITPGVIERWFTKSFREAHPELVEPVVGMLHTTPPHGYAACSAAVRDMDQREAIHSITSPVLVIVGRHDPATPPGMGALIASSIKGAKLVTLETAHLSNIEDPESFTKTVLDFLTETTDAALPPEAREELPIDEGPKPAPKPRASRKPKPPASKGPAAAKEAPAPVEEETPVLLGEDGASAALEAPPPAPPKRPRKPKQAASKAPETPMSLGEDSAPVAPEATPPAPPKPPRKPKPAEAAIPPMPEEIPVVLKPAAPARQPKPTPAAKKPAVTKAPAKKAPVKKAAAKKAVAKKAPAKKAPVKKIPVKKAAVKKAPAKKMPVKKAVAKKAPMKKTPAKKSAVKKGPAKKMAVKKMAVKKTAIKKTAMKKTAAKKSATKKVMKKAVPRKPAKKTAGRRK